MVSQPGIESDLGQLRSEIPALLDLPPLSPQFVTWLGKLLLLVEAGFGKESVELRRLRTISPELPSEFYDSVATRLQSLGMNKTMTSSLLVKLYKDVPKKILQQRLRDYDELIGTMIYDLQSNR